MKIIRKAKQFQEIMEKERLRGRTLGFVPTMGALHEGHLALVHASRKQNQITAVSIFVNPTQFGPNEDFSKYPRVLRQDSLLLKKAKVDYLFYPSVDEIYPSHNSFSVKLDPQAEFATGLCGRFRPGHFEGVATVVVKLFNLSGACRVYLGAKDYQQTVVIRNVVRDLLLPIQIVVCPTVREKDGLAMSSRNRYLSTEERLHAAAIPQALSSLRHSFKSSKRTFALLASCRKKAIQYLKQNGLKVQYFECVDAATLAPIRGGRPKRILAAVACYAGKTRLIDNVII